MMTTLIVIGIVAVHLFGAGMAYPKLKRAIRECEPRVGTGLAAFLWPISIIWYFGARTDHIAWSDILTSRIERRRQKEIEEAEHKVRLAKIRADETKALEQALEK